MFNNIIQTSDMKSRNMRNLSCEGNIAETWWQGFAKNSFLSKRHGNEISYNYSR